MEVDVLARSYGYAVDRGGSESPLVECRDNGFFEAETDSLEDDSPGHNPVFIDGHFDNDVTSDSVGQFGADDGRVGRDDRERDANVVITGETAGERTKNKSGHAGFQRFVRRSGLCLREGDAFWEFLVEYGLARS